MNDVSIEAMQACLAVGFTRDQVERLRAAELRQHKEGRHAFTGSRAYATKPAPTRRAPSQSWLSDLAADIYTRGVH